MELFKSINGWWEPDGPMHILYAYNYERIKFMRKFMNTSDQIQPFSGLKVLDVGCGAGFLS
jgi:2-polyprenyl-3-methyl-5-hydroxy-6-metoxy-1,4-benzoquinol methylase